MAVHMDTAIATARRHPNRWIEIGSDPNMQIAVQMLSAKGLVRMDAAGTSFRIDVPAP